MVKLPPKLLQAFDKLVQSGKAVGDKPLIVGGFVRDWVAGKSIEEVHDFDVISEQGKIYEILNDLSARFGLGQPQKYDYTGTMKLLIDGYMFEFQDPQNSHVHFPIEGELQKIGVPVDQLHKNIFERDFTIDTLCYDVTEQHIMDLTGFGLSDLLEDKLIRTPIPAMKAVEFNPLIIIRMVRMMIEFGLRPDPDMEKAIPYGVQLLPQMAKERSEKFIKKLVGEVFEKDHAKASELFTQYNLWGNVPMGKELMDEKVKSDMGIKFQASLMSVRLNRESNSVHFGITSKALLEPGVEIGLKEALSDLFLYDKIGPETRIMLLDTELGTLPSLGAILAQIREVSWYRLAQQSNGGAFDIGRTNPGLHERYQRRREYRQRKRREQKRDRVGKIKSWRDFKGMYGR